MSGQTMKTPGIPEPSSPIRAESPLRICRIDIVRERLVFIVAVLVAACARGSPAPRTSQPVRSVILITIDTLRADHVGVYGYSAARTPTLDNLARDGVRFDRAYATAPITLVSHASLLTGRYPPGHGARHNGQQVDPSPPTLAEQFQRAGFATGA